MKELAPRFSVELRDRQMLTVFIPEDMKSFRKLTGRSFYTLAVYSSRRGIITQPGKTLKRLRKRGRLRRTLTHELVHFFVDRVAGYRCPTWLNEGLAQWFEGMRPKDRLMPSEEGLRTLELRWRAQTASVAQRRQDYLLSLAWTARLMARVGEEDLLASLQELGKHRDPLEVRIRGHALRRWLFEPNLPEAPVEEEPGFVVERDVDWEREIAEELGAAERTGGKVYDFDKARREKETGITPLPLDEMLKKAKKTR